MQPVYAQETHGSTETHSGSTTTAPSGTEHGTEAQQTGTESHGTEAAGTEHAAQSSEHQSTDGHDASAAAGDVKAESHAAEGHDAAQGTTAEHGAASSESHGGEEHGAEHGTAAHAGGHGEAAEHSGGYHPPAPYRTDFSLKHVEAGGPDPGFASVHLNTLITTWMVLAILLVMAVSATRNLAKKPGKGQVFFESLVDLPHYVVKSQISHHTERYVPLIGTIFLFILVSNWLGLFPWRIIEFFTPPHFELASPTNDLNTNAAIALTAVASYWFFGIKKKGLSHFKHYFQPMWFLFPLNMMEDVSRPLSLSFRLFGNILGGEIVIGILLFLTAPLVVTSLVVLPMFTLEVLVGFIQAFIFSMLTASYIGGMVAEHH